MIKLVKVGDAYVNGSHREYIIDSSSDIDNLPGIEECAAGSIAKSTDGVTYIMSPSGDWSVYNSVSGSSEVVVTQTITSGTEIGSVNGTKLYAPTSSSADGANNLDDIYVIVMTKKIWDESDQSFGAFLIVTPYDNTTGTYYFRGDENTHANVSYGDKMPGRGWSILDRSCKETIITVGDNIMDVVKVDSNNNIIAYGWTSFSMEA